MKRLLLIAAVGSFALISCKKEKNCKCSNGTIYTVGPGTSVQNEQECKSFEVPGQITCELEDL